MKCVNFAFAGFRHGHILSLYNQLLSRADVRIVGAWEADPAARAQAEEKGVVFTYDTLEQLLADSQVDVVAIGDYFAARGNIALQALQAGKHVIADKPLCTRRSEAEAIGQEAAKRGLAVGIMLDLRDNVQWATVLDAVKNGIIGKVNNIIFEGQHPLMYGSRAGWYFEEGKYGGVINDIAIHAVDIVRLLTGSDVAEVVGARCWNFYANQEPGFGDSGQFVLRMGSGAGVMGDVSYAAPDGQLFSLPCYWHFRIWGEKGLLDFAYNQPEITLFAKGEQGGRLLPQVQEYTTYLDRFLAVLAKPEAIPNYNKENLASSCQALWIQEVADQV